MLIRMRPTIMRLLLPLWLGALLCARNAEARPIRVLMVTGDWKAQAWYQDVWMGGKVLYRGRFIADAVNRAAPGKYEFTDITNYLGQEYVDASYLSQFDVFLLADTNGWSLPPRFLEGLRSFVRRGGGFFYCASYKWATAMLNGTALEEVLPARFAPVGNITEDWQAAKTGIPDQQFVPRLTAPDHPIVRGLSWSSMPPLAAAYQIAPKPGASVLLKAPSGAPILAAAAFGSGRSLLSASLFANDELSPNLGSWPETGRYYAQAFAWLAAGSTAHPAQMKESEGAVTLSADFTHTLNPIRPADFSIHGAQDDPSLSPLAGLAEQNFRVLHLEGSFGRLSADTEPEPGKFDYSVTDARIAECRRLGLEPLVLFAAITYGGPRWMWPAGSSYGNPSEFSVNAVTEQVAALLAHYNGGTGANAGYKRNITFIEIANEPTINGATIEGYCRLFRAVAKRVHHDFPGVQVGGMGGYEIPYVHWFLDRCGPDVDWISRHPYGWTGEMLFDVEDEFAAYGKAHGARNLKFIVTEADYWIQGRAKFDYMMKRDFEALRRENCLGVIHYRMGQYGEPIYLFGVEWAGWGREHGAGEKGAPMHDAYDAFWIFRDFRGDRAATGKSGATTPGLASHVHLDAARQGDALNAVVYYDWAYGGKGYEDYATGRRMSRVAAHLQLRFHAAARARSLRVAHATGEGFGEDAVRQTVPAGAVSAELALTLEPMTAYSITIR